MAGTRRRVLLGLAKAGEPDPIGKKWLEDADELGLPRPGAQICLALPETVEDGAGVGSPSFKVRDKIFAMRHGSKDGRNSLWFKGGPGVQQALVSTDPERYFVPPYVGHHGWVGAYLDEAIDWKEVDSLIVQSYRMTAPKRLLALLPP